MDRRQRLLERLRRGQCQNVSFADFCRLIEGFGFALRTIRGSHHQYKHPSVRQMLTIQSRRGQAKPVQLMDFLKLVDRYNLTLGAEP